jgi:hypothetical protein
MYESAVSSTEAHAVRALSRAGAWAGVAGTILTIAWLMTMIAAPLPAGGSVVDHVEALRGDDIRRSLLFVVVVPLGLTFVPVWIALAARAWRAHPVAASLAVAYGLMYAPLSTTAYWLQLTAARGIADAYGRDPVAAIAAYQLFDFGATTSLTSALDVLGYAVLGLGTIAATWLLWSDGRLGRLTGLAFAASGTLSIVGAAGIALRWDWLAAGAIIGGLPFLIGIIGVTWILGVLPRQESLRSVSLPAR